MEEKEVKNSVGTDPDANTAAPVMDINADAELPGTTHLSNPAEDLLEREKWQQELAEWKDKFIRQVAEFDNFRKRTARERLELAQTAGKDVISALLDVLDDCDRAQQQMESSEDLPKIREGVLLVFNKLRNILQARGLKPMESRQQEFNPDLHEAITEMEVAQPGLKGKVIDEVQKGYYLNDKIIRFAKVVVGK